MSLVLGVQTLEDAGRSFCSCDVTTSTVFAHEFTPISHCKILYSGVECVAVFTVVWRRLRINGNNYTTSRSFPDPGSLQYEVMNLNPQSN